MKFSELGSKARIWESVRMIRAATWGDKAAYSMLLADPTKFLGQRELDFSVEVSDGKQQPFSKLLNDAAPNEREAILSSVFALASRGTTVQRLDAGGYGYEENPLPPDDPPPGDDQLAIVFANLFVNANVASNANMVEATNTNMVQWANSNCNTNANGCEVESAALEILRVKNSLTVQLPSDYSSSELCKDLQGIGLSIPRQTSLFKLAVTESDQFAVESPVANGITVEKKYRNVQFRLTAQVKGTEILISKVEKL